MMNEFELNPFEIKAEIARIFEELKGPLIKNFPASHSAKKATIPLG